MKQVDLAVKIRESLGKSSNKKLRNQGWVPAVVYGRSKKPLSLQIPLKEFSKALQGVAGTNVVVGLAVDVDKEGKTEAKTALIKEIQHHPISGAILHVDFHEISLTEEIKVNVPVVSKGEAIGVKMDGGVLDHSIWELEVTCLATQIPDRIEADVTDLKIGDSIHVRDLKVPIGVKILADPDVSVFSVKHPTEEVAPAAAAEEVTVEPEVIREKKTEEAPAEGQGAPQAKEIAKAKEPAKPPQAKEAKTG